MFNGEQLGKSSSDSETTFKINNLLSRKSVHRTLMHLPSPDGVSADGGVADFELHDFGAVVDGRAGGLGEVALEWEEGRGGEGGTQKGEAEEELAFHCFSMRSFIKNAYR